jgi:hypothetical protein
MKMHKEGELTNSSESVYTEEERLNDGKKIETYVDPHLKSLREKEKLNEGKVIEQVEQRIHETFKENTNDSSLAFKDAFPTKEKTIWSKPQEKVKKGWFSWFKNPFTKRNAALVVGVTAAMAGKAQGPNVQNIDSNQISIETKSNSYELANQKRCADWNDYTKWIKAKGLKGDESLDHNEKGMAVLQQYINEHPETTLQATPEVVKSVQLQLKAYRDFAIKQLREHKAQLTYIDENGREASRYVTKDENLDFFMKNLSIVDGIPGHRTVSSEFPKAYLVTLESKDIDYNTVANKATKSKNLQEKITNVMNNNYKVVKVENKGFAKTENLIPNRNPIAGSDYVKNDIKNIPKNKK